MLYGAILNISDFFLVDKAFQEIVAPGDTLAVITEQGLGWRIVVPLLALVDIDRCIFSEAWLAVCQGNGMLGYTHFPPLNCLFFF